MQNTLRDTPAENWEVYVGSLTPEQFMGRSEYPGVQATVEQYVHEYPWGIPPEGLSESLCEYVSAQLGREKQNTPAENWEAYVPAMTAAELVEWAGHYDFSVEEAIEIWIDRYPYAQPEGLAESLCEYVSAQLGQ